jgi:carbonic anhydrase
MGDGAGLEPAVRAEVDRVRTALGEGPLAAGQGAWIAAVQRNVRRQVAIAVERFAPEVEAGTLWVVGAIYDFRDDLERGQGRVVVVDVNGSDAPADTPLLQLVLSSEPVDEAVAPGGGRRHR